MLRFTNILKLFREVLIMFLVAGIISVLVAVTVVSVENIDKTNSSVEHSEIEKY